MFKLRDKISIGFKGKKITGELIGIDNYVLQTFADRTIRWPSYTLTSNNPKPFDRYWFVCWNKKDWVLWLAPPKNVVPASAKLMLEKSGVAKIAFTGDAGVSTPVAALAQYKVGKNYFCAERFADSKTMFFVGYPIARPKLG